MLKLLNAMKQQPIGEPLDIEQRGGYALRENRCLAGR
jgi:hypothetical protein